jgi:predicted DNA-binding protein (UPF0251 family)
MTRGFKRRRIGFQAKIDFYKPQGVPIHFLEVVLLKEDEIEAIRLADEQGLYHEAAAEHMEISRQTFGNILRTARNKIATALINGKAIQIENLGKYLNRVETVSEKNNKNIKMLDNPNRKES